MSKHGEAVRDMLVMLRTLAGDRVHEEHVPQLDLEPDAEFSPYIFFNQDGILRDEALDDVGRQPVAFQYSVECIASNPDDSTAMQEAIMPIDGQRNLLDINGTDTIVFIDEQSGDYVPRGLRPDVGSNVKSLILEIHVIGGCA